MKSLLKHIKVYLVLVMLFGINHQSFSQNENAAKLANKTFQVNVSIDNGNVNVKITDLKQNVVWADGIYMYELGEMISGQLKKCSGLELPKLERQFDRIRIRGLIGGFEIEHDLIVASGSPFLAEEMKIVNTHSVLRNVKQFTSSFCKKVTGSDGKGIR